MRCHQIITIIDHIQSYDDYLSVHEVLGFSLQIYSNYDSFSMCPLPLDCGDAAQARLQGFCWRSCLHSWSPFPSGWWMWLAWHLSLLSHTLGRWWDREMWNHPDCRRLSGYLGSSSSRLFSTSDLHTIIYYFDQGWTIKSNRSKSACVHTWHMAWHNVKAATLGQL